LPATPWLEGLITNSFIQGGEDDSSHNPNNTKPQDITAVSKLKFVFVSI
jgi:hypothetical protein